MLPDGALDRQPCRIRSALQPDKFAEDRDNLVDVRDAQITFASTAIGEKHLRNFAQSFSGVASPANDQVRIPTPSLKFRS